MTTYEPESRTEYDQGWLSSLLRPTLISAMAASLSLAIVAFARRVSPEVGGAYLNLLAVIGIFSAVIGCISTTWLAQPAQRLRRSTGIRAAEITLILLVTRVGIWLLTDSWPPLDLLLTRPVAALIDGGFLLGAIVALVSWALANAMTGDQLAMALQPDDIYMARTFNDRWQDMARPVYTDRAAILRGFTARWVGGGLLLVILAAGSRFEMPETGLFGSGIFGIIKQGIDPVVIGSIIVYFLAGLLLISQGQLALLRARWTLQKTPATPTVLTNWPIYVAALLVVVGVAAALLPMGGTFWLAIIISGALSAFFNFVFGIFRFLLGLLLLLVSLLSGEPAEDVQPEPPPLPPPPMPTLMPTGAEMPPWIGGAFFWAIALLLLGYAAYVYFSGRGVDFAWAKTFWRMLLERWMQIFGVYRAWQRARLHPGSAQEEGESGGRMSVRHLLHRMGFLRLDPEQQVRFYYLATLEEAEESKIPRRKGETPAQYAPRLSERLGAQAREASASEPGEKSEPEDRVAVTALTETLTEAFVAVRYGGRRADAESLPKLKQIWGRAKAEVKRGKILTRCVKAALTHYF